MRPQGLSCVSSLPSNLIGLECPGVGKTMDICIRAGDKHAKVLTCEGKNYCCDCIHLPIFDDFVAYVTNNSPVGYVWYNSVLWITIPDLGIDKDIALLNDYKKQCWHLKFWPLKSKSICSRGFSTGKRTFSSRVRLVMSTNAVTLWCSMPRSIAGLTSLPTRSTIISKWSRIKGLYFLIVIVTKCQKSCGFWGLKVSRVCVTNAY